jgi:hypothetical protein
MFVISVADLSALACPVTERGKSWIWRFDAILDQSTVPV